MTTAMETAILPFVMFRTTLPALAFALVPAMAFPAVAQEASPGAEIRRETGGATGGDNSSIVLESARLGGDLLDRGYDDIRAKRPTEAILKFQQVVAAYEVKYAGKSVRCANNDLQGIVHGFAAILAKDTPGPRQVIVVGSEYCSAIFGQAFALIDLNRHYEAEPLLLRAIELEPAEPHYINELGELHKFRKQWRLAHDTFARALAVGKELGELADDMVTARSMRGMGFAKIELGDLDDARRLFLQSQEYDPNSPAAKAELAYIEEQEELARRSNR